MKTSELIKENISLSKYSTFKIGGFARYLVEVFTLETLLIALDFAKINSIPTLMFGRGSNCLFNDNGFDGMIIINKLDFFSSEENEFVVGAGCCITKLGILASKKGFGGLEFAVGIPASVGGSIYMNAGAGKQNISQIIKKVTFVDSDLKLKTLGIEDLEFNYRSSSFHKMKNVFITSAIFNLYEDPLAFQNQARLFNDRKLKQPYSEFSAGCIFKNPYGDSAGRLIDSCSLKGFSIGGAKISEKHANFIVNTCTASSKDVMNLISFIQDTVYEKTNILLELEVQIINFTI